MPNLDATLAEFNNRLGAPRFMVLREEPNAVDELARNKAILKRVPTPEDLVGASTFLASDRSDYMTGQNLMVEGGVRMV